MRDTVFSYRAEPRKNKAIMQPTPNILLHYDKKVNKEYGRH